MKILAIDVGTGTQDILLFDSHEPIENALQMIMPAPTQIAAGRIRRAARAERPIALSGVVAGGGPSHWALEEYLKLGLPAYATPQAAATFDDDLDVVRGMGLTIVSEDELRLLDAERITLRDLDLDAVRTALAAFDVDIAFDGLALGCLDHGAAPPGYSDRLFRFDHLRRLIESQNDLRSFAFLPQELPEYLTRARSLAQSAKGEGPIVFVDTGPAAALGALQDPSVAAAGEQIVLNLGNMHTLAFHLHGTHIHSLYEHHTGEITVQQIERFTRRLLSGDLRHEEVFDSKGHGVYYADHPHDGEQTLVAVTGPRRGLLATSSLDPYFAVPHGDMMLSGCFGLLWGFAHKFPEAGEEILPAICPAP